MSEKLQRKAKVKGNSNRELSSYCDNLSSSISSDNQNMVLSQTSQTDDDMDSLSSSTAPSPVPPPQSNTNEAELQLIDDQGNLPSLPSSISPPPAPAPAPLIMDENELQMENNEIEHMVSQKQEIEKSLKEKKEELKKKEEELKKEAEELKILEEKEKKINKYFIDICRKTCFLSLEINGKFSDDILIKLYYDKAPITCNYFRSMCTGERGFGFENTSFNYLRINGFIQGGEKEIFTRDGNRFFDQVEKQKDQRLGHDKPGLLSMALHDCSTKFIITLSAMPCLNDTHVVFGEVSNGMDLLNSINSKGIRNVSRGGADDTLTDAETGGVPIDKIVIYACGEKD